MQNSEKEIHKEYYLKPDIHNFLRYKWYAESYFGNEKNMKILEIGGGGVAQFLKDSNKVCAVDISKNAVKFMKERGITAHLIDVSTENLPFPDSSFDVVICLEVIEHLKSPQHAIEEIQRVLRKNGRFIISIPNPRTGHKVIYPSLFNFGNFKEYLENNRFIILSTSTYGFCPPFWNYFQSSISRKYTQMKKESIKSRKFSPTFFSKIARFLSSDVMNSFKPRIYAWSFVYECGNINQNGARQLYTEIAEETRRVYN